MKSFPTLRTVKNAKFEEQWSVALLRWDLAIAATVLFFVDTHMVESETMVRVVGIDPGTRSFDLCGINDGKVFLDTSIPSTQIAENPESLIEVLKSAMPLDLIVAPSGYGLPLTHISKLGQREHFLTILVRPDDLKISVLKGLRKLVNMMKDEGFNAFFIPGVIHLPTVPEYRKVNKIDMGTADKLCCAVLAIHDQSQRLGIPYSQTSLILVEMGFGYNAVIAVEDGQIVDGIGGTTGGLGFLTMGAMDGELAYLLGGFSKETLFQGGAAYVASNGAVTPEMLVEGARSDRMKKVALDAFVDSVLKSVAAIAVSVKHPREILISGRISRVQKIYEIIHGRLSTFGQVRKVDRFAEVSKEAAQGAALIADGLAGGRFKELVEATKIKEATGTVLDHIYLPNAGALKRKYGL